MGLSSRAKNVLGTISIILSLGIAIGTFVSLNSEVRHLQSQLALQGEELQNQYNILQTHFALLQADYDALRAENNVLRAEIARLQAIIDHAANTTSGVTTEPPSIPDGHLDVSTTAPNVTGSTFLQEMIPAFSFVSSSINNRYYSWNQPGQMETDNRGDSHDNGLGLRLAWYGLEQWIQVEFDLRQQYSIFEATYVLNQNSRNRTGTYVLSIYLDGRRHDTTWTLTTGTLPIDILPIEVSGVDIIGFRVSGSNRAYNDSTHLALVNATFHR